MYYKKTYSIDIKPFTRIENGETVNYVCCSIVTGLGSFSFYCPFSIFYARVLYCRSKRKNDNLIIHSSEDGLVNFDMSPYFADQVYQRCYYIYKSIQERNSRAPLVDEFDTAWDNFFKF